MSDTPWIEAWFGTSNFGRTVFFTEDDKSSLKEIYSSSNVDGITGNAGDSVVHGQRIKEDLLIGANGQIDIFRLNSKGMNADNKDSISRDPVTGWDSVNDYNVPTIANFNPYEGDKIMINRRLYSPLNPISASTKLPKTMKSGRKVIATSKFLKSIKIDLITTNGREEIGTCKSELCSVEHYFGTAEKPGTLVTALKDCISGDLSKKPGLKIISVANRGNNF